MRKTSSGCFKQSDKRRERTKEMDRIGTMKSGGHLMERPGARETPLLRDRIDDDSYALDMHAQKEAA